MKTIYTPGTAFGEYEYRVTIDALDLSALPEQFRLNWHIYLTLRSDAQVKFATACANAAVVNSSAAGWSEEFDKAKAAWVEANPTDPVWDSEWPKDAAVFLGHAATDEARRLIASAKNSKNAMEIGCLEECAPLQKAD